MSAVVVKKEEVRKEHIPDLIVNPGTGKRYIKGRFLGKVNITHAQVNWSIIMIQQLLK